MHSRVNLYECLRPLLTTLKAKHAHKKGITLKESAMELEALSSDKFDEIVRPELMIAPADKK